jgi:hypothetical protein
MDLACALYSYPQSAIAARILRPSAQDDFIPLCVHLFTQFLLLLFGAEIARGRSGLRNTASWSGACELSKSAGQPSPMPEDVVLKLRALAHDLSNSIETILQAGYLLGQVQLDPNHKKWVQLIDNASQDAAKINREIRDILRSQG